MITNKEYADLVINSGAFNEGMRKYFETSTLYADNVSLGVIGFDKPHLHTRFCYGWGQCASPDSAASSCEAVQNNYDVFLSENLDDSGLLKDLDVLENRPEEVYLVKTYREGNFVGFRSCKPWESYKDYVKATDEDIEVLKKGVKAQIENLTKRCAAYWKRFGGSKLKTWTYWADE